MAVPAGDVLYFAFRANVYTPRNSLKLHVNGVHIVDITKHTGAWEVWYMELNPGEHRFEWQRVRNLPGLNAAVLEQVDHSGRSDWPGGWGGRRHGTATPGAPASCDRSVQRPVHCRERRGHGTLLPYDGLDDNPTLEVGMTTHRSPPTKCSSFYLAHRTIFYKLIYVIKIYYI